MGLWHAGVQRAGKSGTEHLQTARKRAELFLLFYRGKNDPIGSNASPANPKFREEVNRYLSLLEEDILVGAIETINLDGDIA